MRSTQGKSGKPLVWVRDGSGEESEVLSFELDCGRNFKLPNGPWIPESDPRALRFVRRLLDVPTQENGMLERAQEDHTRWLNHILKRNGWKERLTAAGFH